MINQKKEVVRAAALGYRGDMKPTWSFLTPDPVEVKQLCESLGCHRAVAEVLVNRGIHTPQEALCFLNPSLAALRSPFLMKDMEQAVERILKALKGREKVVIFGDYDVDGITATALVFTFLNQIGMDVDFHIPDRFEEGYGLGQGFVENHAAPNGVALIVTVDCGVSSHEAVKAARSAGIDVIVTDHHQVPLELPDAVAILNPKRPDCPSGFTWLAGVGVAFKLVLALRKRLRDIGFWENRPEPNLKAACDLVALGTVADLVPLLEENRVYVKTGLEVLASGTRVGAKALLDLCGISERPLGTWDLAFKLGPRLNAAGRISQGSTGLELLTALDVETAYNLAGKLEIANAKRQELEKRMLSGILRSLEAQPRLLEGNALVLAQEGWHEGVIGIVASRLLERFLRPVILISVADGQGKGSARGPQGFDLYGALKGCGHHLERFGGHAVAAGLSLKTERIPAFRAEFEDVVSRRMPAEGFRSTLEVDATLSPDDICGVLADELEQLAPFGPGNPEPLFLLSNLNVLSHRTVGARHVQMRLSPAEKPSGKPIDAICFNAGPDGPTPDSIHHMVFRLRWNRWQGRKSLQLVVKDYASGPLTAGS